MMKYIFSKKGQAVIGEYVISLFLIVAVVSAMTVYIKRALQARIYDTRNVMIDIVGESYDGNLFFSYEPYYGNTASTVTRDFYSQTRFLQGKQTNIFRKVIDERTEAKSKSIQLPPKNAD